MQRRSVGETVLAIFTQASAEHLAYLTGRLPRLACHYSARELMDLSLAAGGILRIDKQRDGLLDQAIKAIGPVGVATAWLGGPWSVATARKASETAAWNKKPKTQRSSCAASSAPSLCCRPGPTSDILTSGILRCAQSVTRR